MCIFLSYLSQINPEIYPYVCNSCEMNRLRSRLLLVSSLYVRVHIGSAAGDTTMNVLN